MMNNSEVTSGLSPAGKLGVLGIGVLLVVGGGTAGFMFLEDMDPLNALYMTVITLSTVGFGEVRPLHASGRLFVIVLIVFGVILAAAIAKFVGEWVLEGHFKHLVTRRKMETKLKKISDHFIIAGFGRVGSQVATQFLAKKVPFVVIEKDSAGAERIMEKGALVLQGNATDDDVLLEAGIDRAHTLISTLPEEAQNVYLTLTARHMNPKLRIIARADYEDGEKKLLRAGADHVVIPHVLGGIRMAKAALQPNVTDFMHMASMGDEGLLVEELVVPRGSFLAGKSLFESQLKQKYGTTIIGVKQEGEKMDINPKATTVLNNGDILVVIGRTDDLERLSKDLKP